LRVAILTEIISPYRIPVFNQLATYPEIDLKVIFASETEARRHWHVQKEQIQFSYEVLPGRVVAKTYQNGSLFFNPTIISSLHRGKYDVIIFGGYHHPSYWLALAYCKVFGKQIILWSESTIRDFRLKSIFRHNLKKLIIKSFNRYLVPGSAQRDYLRTFDIIPSAIWIAPNAVDIHFFTTSSEQHSKQKDIIKRSFGISGNVVLSVGRLIDEKGIDDLLHAFEQITRKHGKHYATLVIVGSGEGENRYREFVQLHDLPILFVGFQQQENLPRYYAIADVFVFPTHTDPWGLVLNEAMACGLPIISSSAAGAIDDLVKHGDNGFIHTARDVTTIANYIETLLDSPEIMRKMGERSKEIIQNYTPEKCAIGFRNVILGLENE